GILACVVLATCRWWLGLGLLIVWRLARRPLSALVRFQAARVRRAGEPLRRSWYLLGLAWRSPAAKEVRVFGLGDWLADRHRDEWLAAVAPARAEVRPVAPRAGLS